MHSQLLSVLEEKTNLNEKEQDLFRQFFQPKYLRKGDLFQRSGTYNCSIGFLKKGLVHYYTDKDGQETTKEFSKEGEFVTDYQSFVNKEPAIQNIQAIENCELLVISHFELQQLTSSSEIGKNIGAYVLEHRFNTMIKHLLSSYMHSPMERYQYFMDNYGALCNRIPQRMIASYVGVKPQSLCRIRKRIVNDIS